MLSREADSHTRQHCDNVLDLLRTFLDKHRLGVEQLAALLRISPRTLEEWFSEGEAPPASCLALALLFDTRRPVPAG